MVSKLIKNSKNSNEFIYFKKFDTIPVFNYYKIQKTNDLRYLIANVDVNDLPELNEKQTAELNKAFYEFNLNIDNVNFELQKAYFRVLTALSYYQEEKTTRQKVDDLFNVYCKILDKYFKNYEYDNQIFETALELRNHLLSSIEVDEIYFYSRLNILNYNNIIAESRGNWDLYADITAIKTYVNIDIDEFNCSMSKFIYLKKQANKIYNYRKKEKK